MSQTVAFDGAPPPGTINFGIGQPSADLLPVELVREASAAFFDEAQPFELNYGVVHGDKGFLQSLAGFLSRGYGSETSSEELFVSGGNSQALDMVSVVFADPGDTVFVEEPSYFLAFQIFRDHGLNIVGIPVDDNGLCVESLKKALQTHSPAFLYTIPSYHNPSGQCTTESRRAEIVELAQQHDFLIVADEVYQLLYYFENPPAAYGSMAASDHVVSLGSFAKILAPGMRLGWIQSSPRLRVRLAASGFINSGGSINHISSLITRKAIDNGSLESHIDALKVAYRSRVEAMDEALREHFDGIAVWTRPNGGYFFWLRFDESVETALLLDEARKVEAGFQAGNVFSSTGGLRNFMRLSFAHYNEHDIREGVARIRPLFD